MERYLEGMMNYVPYACAKNPLRRISGVGTRFIRALGGRAEATRSSPDLPSLTPLKRGGPCSAIDAWLCLSIGHPFRRSGYGRLASYPTVVQSSIHLGSGRATLLESKICQ